jgi:hypothetical protein
MASPLPDAGQGASHILGSISLSERGKVQPQPQLSALSRDQSPRNAVSTGEHVGGVYYPGQTKTREYLSAPQPARGVRSSDSRPLQPRLQHQAEQHPAQVDESFLEGA